jgi:hypothetical protein
MLALENEQVIILIKEDHLVEGGFITALFKNYTEFLVAKTAVSFLKTFQSMLSVFRIPHEVKLVE